MYTRDSISEWQFYQEFYGCMYPKSQAQKGKFIHYIGDEKLSLSQKSWIFNFDHIKHFRRNINIMTRDGIIF